MRTFLILLLIITCFILLLIGCQRRSSQSETMKETEKKLPIRQPAVAGQFYPAEPELLAAQIDDLLAKAGGVETKGEIIGLILPHAGYEFSGQVAAYGFKKLIGEEIETVILIGSSHTETFEGISIFKEGFYKTPLGKIEVDSSLAEKIINEHERIFFRDSAHRKEHSLEVELPFLQRVLKDFKIVPIIFGTSFRKEDYQILAQALTKNIRGKNVLLVASSDLSHYPSYKEAKYADSKTIEAILKGEVEEVEKTIQDLEKEEIPQALTFACGEEAIKTVMLVAKGLGANEIKLLNYANSGDVMEDKSRVVGYAACGFFGSRRGNLLNKTEQQKLLEIARGSVETFIRQGKIPDFKAEAQALQEKRGAFVTLKKQGHLRGCIGHFGQDVPLYQVVSEMARAAATQDRRFLRVKEDELDELEYEISVLSPLKRVDQWQEIKIGQEGVQIRKGLHSGVFLPQVARENNWDLETFLGELCSQKAGLSQDCFRDPEVELFIFTAQVCTG